MKADRRSEAFFERLPDRPVDLKAFDPLSKQRSAVYRARLDALLAPLGAAAELFGSVELEIAGKGEWEYAIWLDDEHWFPVIIALINHYGAVHALTDDFAVFVDIFEGTEIEVIPLRGAAAQRNRAFMDYMRSHPAALQAYEAGKIRTASTKKEYYRFKDKFIADIIELL